MICQTCHKVLERPLEWPELSGHYSRSFPHHATVQSLQNSVESGCLVCASFWSTFAPEERDIIFDSVIPREESSEQHAPDDSGPPALTLMSISFITIDRLDIHVKLKSGVLGTTGGSGGYTWFQAEKAKMGERESKIDLLSSLRLSNSTKSSETLLLAKSWIADCLENHSNCKSPRKGNWYPSRLLDLGPLDAPEASTIQLLETNTTAPIGRYMSLSHCWGEGHFLTLNTESYHELLNGVPLSSLPQTFQDASFVARQLGVRYLWIDALCIFQDQEDRSDWNREASLMHKVYSNSLCNIVAADTPDSSHSMFRTRDSGSMIPPITKVTVQASRWFLGNDTPFAMEYVVSDARFWDQVGKAPINTRAWVMQERFMSPRALHFGAQQLFWECREKDAAEVNPDGLSIYSPNAGFKAKYIDMRHRPSSEDRSEWARGYTHWDSLVETYTACALSVPTDKLIAISAIAKQVAAVFKDDYVAGMWRRSLEAELLWTVDSEKGEPTRLETYIAPSWSWASVTGRVHHNIESGDSLIQVEDYKLEHVTKDRTGSVRGGWLRLSGCLRRLKLLRRESGETGCQSWSMVVNGLEAKWHESNKAWSVCLDDPLEDFEEENEKGTLYCMPAREDLIPEYGTYLDALLFQLVDADKGMYRRIGTARGPQEEIGQALMQEALNEKSFPCAEYKNGRHSIYIL